MCTIAERAALQRRYLAQIRQRVLAARARGARPPAVFFLPTDATKSYLNAHFRSIGN